MLQALVLFAQEHAEETEEFSPVKPIWADLIWAGVFFVLLFLLLSKFVLPRLKATLEAREAAVVGQVQKAEQTRTEADSVLAEYRAKLADAQSEANRIIDEGRRTAEGIVAEARTRAEAEAAQLTQRAQADIAAERDRALAALRSTLADVSIQVASRVVGKSLDNDAQRNLVDTYIDELSSAARN
jgi:F-type H+-transporting ATPase subunit b